MAADIAGNVGVFLINEDDMENDDDTLQVQALSFPEGVAFIHHFITQSELKLLILTNIGVAHTY
jgi:hypothetical protein